MPATASVSRMIRLMSCTSGMSTSPGLLRARNSSTRAPSASTASALDDAARRAEPPQEVHVAAHVVVEHRDVAAGHVGDGDLVPVLDQLAEDPAHRDHVVVRDAARSRSPAGRAAASSVPRILAPSALNTTPFSAPGEPCRATQRRQPVLGVVALRELEDRLAGLVREPDDGADRQRRGVHSTAPSSQGVAIAGELGGRGAVEVERGVRVALQERRGDLVVDLALDRPADDRRLVLAGGEDQRSRAPRGSWRRPS